LFLEEDDVFLIQHYPFHIIDTYHTTYSTWLFSSSFPIIKLTGMYPLHNELFGQGSQVVQSPIPLGDTHFGIFTFGLKI
jgi:hypothetical protein